MGDLIEGVIYCDYADPNFSCKPELQFYLNVRDYLYIHIPECSATNHRTGYE